MRAHGRLAMLVFVASALAGCSRSVNLDKVPLGTMVEVTREDGGVVRGTLASRDAQNLHVEVGHTMRTIARDQVAALELADTTTSPRLPAAAKFREYTVPSGTKLSAELNTSLGSDSSRLNDPVDATLLDPVVVDGVELLPAGSTLKGVVTTAESAGNVRGRASLGVAFQSITLSGRDASYPLSTGMHHTAAATKGNDAKKIGIPAVGGAILGAILGGKKGALIGTAVGGGAGAVVVLTTSGPEVRYARGTKLSLSLDRAIDIQVPIRK